MMKNINTICICGGGNLGIVCGGVFLSKDIKVNILTRKPHKWADYIEVKDPDGKTFSGKLNRVSCNPEEVIPEADMVLLTLPGCLIEETLKRIKPYLRLQTVVGSIVATTGFFFAAHEILGNRNVLFGFQRVPYIARINEYGRTGFLLGYKKYLNVAIENSDNPVMIREELERIFNTPVNLLNNYYEVSLSNSNPILHTSRLYSMWNNYNGEVFDHQSLFYVDWTKEASECLIKMDNEFQALLRKLNISEKVIPHILDYYESSDATALTEKIRSIKAFKSIKTPMIKEAGGWVPDFSSRYFTEDFPYGLRFIKELADENNIDCPTIDRVYKWGDRMIKGGKSV